MINNTFSEYFGAISTILILLIIMLISIMATNTKIYRLPPGPFALPIIGNILQLKAGKLELAFAELRAKYGDIFSFKLGTKTFVVVNGYETVRDFFVNKGEYVSIRPNSHFNEKVVKYEGLIFSNGHRMKQQRAFAMTALRGTSFEKNIESMVMEEVEYALGVVGKYQGQPFDPKKMMRFMSTNVISSIVFGRRFDYHDADLMRLVALVEDFFRRSNHAFVSETFPILQYVPGDLFGMKEFVKFYNDIRTYMQQQIDYHQRSYDENNMRDYIDLFLREMERRQEVGSTFTNSQLAMSILDLFIAGSDTTSSVLLWAVVFLVNNSEVQAKMRQELDDVVGSSRFPSYSDKQDLPYTEAVITEIFRRGSISPLSVPHAASCDVKFRGYDIPKGTTILMNLSSVMFDATLFREPLKFDPSRFLDSDGKLCGTEKAIAFSVGKRTCLGESLARTEIFFNGYKFGTTFPAFTRKRRPTAANRTSKGVNNLSKTVPFPCCKTNLNPTKQHQLFAAPSEALFKIMCVI